MRLEYFLTRRYLTSRPRRKFLSVVTLISMGGVALGVMTLIVVLGVMSGFDAFLLDRIVGTESHILVTDPLEGFIRDYEQVMQELEAREDILAVSPVITNLVVLEREGRTIAAFIKGIDLDRERKVTDLQTYLEGGALDLRAGEILLGTELAKNLGVSLGDTIKILPPSRKPKFSDYIVGGFFRSGYYEYDANLAYLSLVSARELFKFPEGVSSIQVKLKDPDRVAQVAISIREDLNLLARTWMQFKPNLFAALKLEKAVQFIIVILIVVVAAFNIISILDMVVNEKTRDIGTLKAIGVSEGSIRTVFILQGLFIGLAGTALGGVLGLALSYILKTYHFIELPANVYYLTTIPVQPRITDFIYIVSAATVLTFLASLYPSYRASKLDPVAALRYE